MNEEIHGQDLLVLHRRLLGGDRIASEKLVEVLLPRLASELERQFRKTDPHLVSDGVTDALLDYCARPAAFDEARNVPLDRFLAKAAWRNIANLLRGEKRRKIREGKAVDLAGQNVVELYPVAGNPSQNEPLDTKKQLENLLRLLPDPTDRRIFDLRAMGERRTGEFAKVMGITHLSIEQQRYEVKRIKDRIDKVLKRGKAPQK
jgi:DNA-directed RNA polymerase specialized sigma24 family protein